MGGVNPGNLDHLFYNSGHSTDPDVDHLALSPAVLVDQCLGVEKAVCQMLPVQIANDKDQGLSKQLSFQSTRKSANIKTLKRPKGPCSLKMPWHCVSGCFAKI